MNSDIKDELEVQSIPVPSQLPERIDLRGLPTHILRSSAVEALNRQNEDLLARLSVALRRLAQTEQQLSEVEHSHTLNQKQLEIYKDQLMVIQERDALVEDRIRSLESESDSLRDQLSRMEALYAELYSTARERSRSFSESMESLTVRLNRHLNYRHKIRSLGKKIKMQTTYLKSRLAQQEIITRDVQSKLGQAAERIQTLRRESDQNQRQLVDSYESQLAKQNELLIRLQKDGSALASRLEYLEHEHQSRIEAENLLVMERRSNESLQSQLHQTTSRLQGELAETRAALKAMTVEAHRQTENLRGAENLNERIRTELAGSSEQVEALQALWNDQQKEIEQHKNRADALQKLNQDLSVSINQQRKEIVQLRQKIESLELSSVLRTGKSVGQDEGGKSNTVQLSRVDSLLAEIQSGFNRQLPDENSLKVMESTGSAADNRDNGAIEAP